MRSRVRRISLLLVLLLILPLVRTAKAETGAAAAKGILSAELPTEGDYVLRIKGGLIADHLETVGGKECLRVDVYLEGVTNERKLSSLECTLLYDSTQLTYEDKAYLSENGVMCTVNPNTAGQIRIAYASTYSSMVDGSTPLLTFWFTVAKGLSTDIKIRFSFADPIKARSVVSADQQPADQRTVGVKIAPFLFVSTTVYGDANCDGKVTAADAALVLRVLVGLDTLSEQGTENALVDGTDTLNANDAVLILRLVVRLITRFPVQ